MKQILKIIVGISVFLILFLGLFLLWISITDYKADEIESIEVDRNTVAKINTDSLTFFIWNIGYAGLNTEMDFFYDGGKQTRTDEATTRNNLKHIADFIAQHKVDFWLLQEVDFKAKRTYNLRQDEYFSEALPQYAHVQALNYKVPFVPVPVFDPMGQVRSGILSFSLYQIETAHRYAFPQIAGWPERLFLLDRCFMEIRHHLASGKELVVLNTHNSAFISNQELMEKELDVIRKKMKEEYEAGNYVVAGGDWNMNPPNFTPSTDFGGHNYIPADVVIPQNYLPKEWSYAFDYSRPSNRHMDESYHKGSTGTTTIDFFIVSPNIEVVEVKVTDLEFTHSDHNPVMLKIVLLD